MTKAQSNTRKLYLASAGVLVFGIAAYGLGRVYPPLGPSAGTVAPAQRYVSSQVGESDVTLGDTSVPQLMQTDAFELMVHDANFRALARDPGFAALAQNPAAMQALAANAEAFKALARDPQSVIVRNNLAQTLSDGGRNREALEVIEPAAADPQSPFAAEVRATREQILARLQATNAAR